VKPQAKQIQDPRETDPEYINQPGMGEEEVNAMLEDMYHRHVQDSRTIEHGDANDKWLSQINEDGKAPF
jgi:hypothetical protein